jgi:hypothetical protein
MDGTVCVLCLPNRERLHGVDNEWPSIRPQSDVSASWRWADIKKRSKETFALAAEEGSKTLALWSSNNQTSELEGKLFYVASKLEVHPNARNIGIGPLMVSLMGHRAVELGCSGVLLNAPPERVRLYLNAGAMKRSVRGWPVPAGLTPMVFEGRGLQKLLEVHDELLEER